MFASLRYHIASLVRRDQCFPLEQLPPEIVYRIALYTNEQLHSKLLFIKPLSSAIVRIRRSRYHAQVVDQGFIRSFPGEFAYHYLVEENPNHLQHIREFHIHLLHRYLYDLPENPIIGLPQKPIVRCHGRVSVGNRQVTIFIYEWPVIDREAITERRQLSEDWEKLQCPMVALGIETGLLVLLMKSILIGEIPIGIILLLAALSCSLLLFIARLLHDITIYWPNRIIPISHLIPWFVIGLIESLLIIYIGL